MPYFILYSKATFACYSRCFQRGQWQATSVLLPGKSHGWRSMVDCEMNPMPGHLFEGNPVGEGTKRRGTDTPVHRPQRPAYFCFIDYAKAFDCVDHNKLWKILKKMGIPDHLTCLLRTKASILWYSAFFTVQLSHLCMTTGKTIALTRQVGHMGGLPWWFRW